MKLIFNSIGSNYSFSFAGLALRQLIGSSKKHKEALRRELAKMFKGDIYLLFKGRDAIQFVLEAYGVGKGDVVMTQAFTCCAVEEAILRTGARPVFVDIGQGGLNLSVATLQAALGRAKPPKAVIVQHTLGAPADIKKIRGWCDQQKVLLIEDLAQSIGGQDERGKFLGSYGDAVVLSFGRDKVVDAVAGGVAIFRNKPRRLPALGAGVSQGVVAKDMLYPLMTWKVRKTYRILLGKLVHRLSRVVGLETSAVVSPTTTATPMPPAYARLALAQLRSLKRQLEHRRRIAAIYYEELAKKATFLTDESTIGRGANLRFAFWVDDPERLIAFMKERGVHIADRWYRAPVDCGRQQVRSTYRKGSCPHAEELARSIINLPTHREVGPAEARQIAQWINQYYHHE